MPINFHATRMSYIPRYIMCNGITNICTDTLKVLFVNFPSTAFLHFLKIVLSDIYILSVSLKFVPGFKIEDISADVVLPKSHETPHRIHVLDGLSFHASSKMVVWP